MISNNRPASWNERCFTPLVEREFAGNLLCERSFHVRGQDERKNPNSIIAVPEIGNSVNFSNRGCVFRRHVVLIRFSQFTVEVIRNNIRDAECLGV